MSSFSPRGMIEIYDDFVLDTGALWHASSDAGGSSDVVADGTNHINGRWRLATDGTDDDMAEVASGLVFEGQTQGVMKLEAALMVETGAVDSVAINVGFNDDPTEASNTLPVELATATFTSNASTFAGLVYDPDATNDDWHVFSVDDDTDTAEAIANLRFSGSGPTADKWQTLQVMLQDQGAGKSLRGSFFVWDGNTDPPKYHAKEGFTTGVDRDAVLCAHIGMENRSTVAHNVDVDYIYLCAGRGTTA